MPFHQPDALRFYTFDLLDTNKVQHAVFTRQGGVSPAPWAELNVGGTVGDEPDACARIEGYAFRHCGAYRRPCTTPGLCIAPT